ncbi:MAG TPA: sigma-54 dependent transcriptional regulator, partial [Terriglobia bacterium]|nr:sigma-54 dependent transcriptional regulator [Terriglobia bacterium]
SMSIRKTPTVLVVDDDAEGRAAMLKVLEGSGYKTLEADNGQQALDILLQDSIDVLVTDLRLPVMDGVELLKRAKAADQEIEVILITGHGTVEVAVEAIKEGAYDFITKPVKKAQLLHAVDKASERQYLSRENKELRSQLNQSGSRKFVYASAEMRNISRMIEQVAPSTATVLITGDSGTGKEIVADAIHNASPRRGKPLIKVSCAALPETLLEAELFGHEKGAFTGANARKEGRFELAHGGSLFLDEVGEISPAVQVKLLRVLQDQKFERLGGTRTIDADVRILAATNKDLQKEVEEKRFREDLFYRLNVINIRIPSLRERKDDIQLLAMHFLKTYADKNQKNLEGFSEDAMLALTSYDWPGNVRELENAVERAVVFTSGTLVPLSVLPQNVSTFGESRHSLTFKIGTPLRELERKAIEITLQHARGDKNLAARMLGVATRTIYRHLEKEAVDTETEGEEVAH